MTTSFQIGDFVYVRKDASRLRDYQNCRGEVVRVDRKGAIVVRFLEQPRSEDSALRFVRLTVKASELVMEGSR
jgi:hypothetical protein